MIAQAGPNGACKMVTEGGDDGGHFWTDGTGNILFPVGSQVTVIEEPMPYVGADGNTPGTGDSQTITIKPGINVASFTNQAYGQLEICKTMLVDHKNGVDDSNFNNIAVFHFSIDGATTGPLSDVQVAAGPLLAADHRPGRAAHDQGEPREDEHRRQGRRVRLRVLLGDGHRPDRRQPRRQRRGNPVTVNVPYFFDQTNGGETLVTVTNRVLRAQVKVCKVVDPGSLTRSATTSGRTGVRARRRERCSRTRRRPTGRAPA